MLLNHYEPECATNFYSELERAISLVPDYETVYRIFNKTFQSCLDIHASNLLVHLEGTFIRTYHILREREAPGYLKREIHDTRVRLRQKKHLQEFCYYDLRNLCHFIQFLYAVDAPERLKKHFPLEELKTRREPVYASLRIIVDHWDRECFYGPDADCAEERIVCYTNGKSDRAYLYPLLFQGAQVNLIRPTMEDGVLYPEFIILEPDNLINISTVSGCFTTYGESPYISLLQRIRPEQRSSATLLGNFAGRLLDEEIQCNEPRSYAECVQEFFQDNALDVLFADLDNNFHREAQNQRRHIARAMNEVLPATLKHFNPKEGMVEPSFYSEMLGLQGRMDYLQLDFRMLLEQKSGKGAFPYGQFLTPGCREEHYVQLLLYMAIIRYNYRKEYEANHGELNAFLLYSKYEKSLLEEGFSPDLLFRALKLRNRIARLERFLAEGNAMRILERLTPESLNTKGECGRLWTAYQRPDIDRLLQPIHQASELERMYYFRFMSFIAREHLQAKTGGSQKAGSGFAAKWHRSLEEKLLAGDIYTGLILKPFDKNATERVSEVNFTFSDTENHDMANFRVGDIVAVYPYDHRTEPDIRSTMVFRATIARIEEHCLRVVLRNTQTDAQVFLRDKERVWAIEHDFVEASFNALYRGMHSFLTAPKERRDLLMMQRKPEVQSCTKRIGEYGLFNNLVQRMLNAKDLFLIIGPPGTGKTSFGLTYTLKEELLHEGTSVLVLSYTNRAIDEVCGKLEKEGLDYLRVGNESTCAEAYRHKLLKKRSKACHNVKELKEMIVQTRIFVGTTASISANLSLLQYHPFSLAIVDEASQILEPHLMPLLSARDGQGNICIRKWVMIGDQKQLPAVVQQSHKESAVEESELHAIHLENCAHSLFERFLHEYEKNPELTYMLTGQGRMHHEIARFPNITFYEGRLHEVPLPHQTRDLPFDTESKNGIEAILRTRRVTFINVRPTHVSESEKVNEAEAGVIVSFVSHICQLEQKKTEGEQWDELIGIIVPYRNQIAHIRNCLVRAGLEQAAQHIVIDTVERFQGSQMKYILYGFTIQKYHQLEFLSNNVYVDADGNVVDRKLNVALTRAKEHLILVGNAELLSNNYTFHKLLMYLHFRHCVFSFPVKKLISGEFSVSRRTEQIFDWAKADTDMPNAIQKGFDVMYAPCTLSDIEKGLDRIGYGCISQECKNKMSVDNDKARLYGHYLFKPHYAATNRICTILDEQYHDFFKEISKVRVVEIGCVTGATGIALVDYMKRRQVHVTYVGMELSTGLLTNSGRLLYIYNKEKTGNDKVEVQYYDPSLFKKYIQTNKTYHKREGLVVSLPYLYDNISASEAENLAQTIMELIRSYESDHVLILVQYKPYDSCLNSYQVFKKSVSAIMQSVQEDTGIVSCMTEEYTFGYEIFKPLQRKLAQTPKKESDPFPMGLHHYRP